MQGPRRRAEGARRQEEIARSRGPTTCFLQPTSRRPAPSGASGEHRRRENIWAMRATFGGSIRLSWPGSRRLRRARSLAAADPQWVGSYKCPPALASNSHRRFAESSSSMRHSAARGTAVPPRRSRRRTAPVSRRSARLAGGTNCNSLGCFKRITSRWSSPEQNITKPLTALRGVGAPVGDGCRTSRRPAAFLERAVGPSRHDGPSVRPGTRLAAAWAGN